MKPIILKTSKQASKTRHVEGVCFLCHDCKQTLPVQASGGTGYAHCKDPDGRERLVCYPCTDKRTREDLKTATRFFAYVSSDGRRLTTWNGGDLGAVYLGEPHPWSRGPRADRRRYLSAVDCHGTRWHGTGAPGMYATLRRCK
jgi:hypothetical protein